MVDWVGLQNAGGDRDYRAAADSPEPNRTVVADCAAAGVVGLASGRRHAIGGWNVDQECFAIFHGCDNLLLSRVPLLEPGQTDVAFLGWAYVRIFGGGGNRVGAAFE